MAPPAAPPSDSGDLPGPAASQRAAVETDSPGFEQRPRSGPPPGSSGARLVLTVQRPATGVVVVAIRGEVDLSAVPRLTELIQQRLTAATLHAVIVDLSEVTFLNSAGAELLVHAQGRADHRGIDLILITGAAPVARMLRLTGLTERFAYRDSVAEAVAHIRATTPATPGR